MAKKQHYMKKDERIRLEEKLRYNIPVAQIARDLGFSRQAVYDEIERGTTLHNCGFEDKKKHYSAARGQTVQDQRRQNKGRGLKIRNDHAYTDFLEAKMLGVQANGKKDRRKRCSPAVALELARREGFQTSICVQTLYSYIDTGLFAKLTNADLPEKAKRKPKEEKTEPRIAHPDLPSITERPAAIADRTEYGHWEMDLVVGPKKGSRFVLLTLTERRTRQELFFKLPNKRARSVRAVFNRLERQLGKRQFREKFKTVTTDNGSEFLEYDKLIKSIYRGKRFAVYYCHSYAAWEKGTNEVHNRMIRRWFPKGTDFAKISKKEILWVQNWMNNYPRKILGWKTPAEAA